MKERLIRNFGKSYFTTKEFFRQFCKKQREYQIEKLKDKDGNIKTESTDLFEVAKDFYSDLYKKHRINKETQKHFLDNVDKKISDSDLHFLNQHITINELEQAIQKTKENKSPGIDGLSSNLYKTCFDILGSALTTVLNFCFCNGQIPYNIKISLLALLYKKGDPELMQNYRPLSLKY